MKKEKELQLRDVQDVLYIIGGRWRGAILSSLCNKEKRFNELKRDLGKITPRTLSKEINILEENKLIESKFEDTANYYLLTAHGKSLQPLIYEIIKWGKLHRKIVLDKIDK